MLYCCLDSSRSTVDPPAIRLTEWVLECPGRFNSCPEGGIDLAKAFGCREFHFCVSAVDTVTQIFWALLDAAESDSGFDQALALPAILRLARRGFGGIQLILSWAQLRLFMRLA